MIGLPPREAVCLGNRPLSTHKSPWGGLGLKVKGEVCGCDFVALSDASPELVVIGEMKQSFTLELVLQAVDRTYVGDEVWLAVGASKWGRGREDKARVKKLCPFLGLGLLTVTRRAESTWWRSQRH